MARIATGFIVTNAPTMDEVEEVADAGGYSLIKYCSGWGIDAGGWSQQNIQRAVRLRPRVIVRTKAGDPSVDRRAGGDFFFVDQTRVEREISPWYRERRDIWIELGNEPNLYPTTDRQMHEFAYFLGTAIDRCEKVFPDAKLIAPAMKIDLADAEKFMRICGAQMRRCHFIGLHAYEWQTFSGPPQGRKGDVEKAFDVAGRLFADKEWLLTEYGIHGPNLSPATKGQRYAELLHQRKLPKQLVGAAYFHLCCDGKVEPEYHIALRGDVAYHQARYSAM